MKLMGEADLRGIRDALVRRREWLAACPALLFAISPLLELVVCVVGQRYDHSERQVYHLVVSEFVFPICTICAIVLALIVAYLRATDMAKPILTRTLAISFFGVFLILAMVSTLVNTSNPYRIIGISPSFVGIAAYFVFVLVYFWPSTCVTSTNVKRLVCHVVLTASVFLGVYALWLAAVLGKDAPASSVLGRPEGIFYNTNHYAYYLAMAIALAAVLWVAEGRRTPRRLCYALAFVFNSVVLTLNNTLGSWLAVLVVLVGMVVFCLVCRKDQFRRACAALVAYLLCLAAVSLWDASMAVSILGMFVDVSRIAGSAADAGRAGSGRWKLWLSTLHYISEKPLLGWGAEGYDDLLLREAGNQRTHNEILMYAGYFGIPAAVCYLAGCASVFMHAWRARARLDGVTAACLAAAAGYLLSSVFGNMYFYTTPLFFVFLGLGVIHHRLPMIDCVIKTAHSSEAHLFDTEDGPEN